MELPSGGSLFLFVLMETVDHPQKSYPVTAVDQFTVALFTLILVRDPAILANLVGRK